MSQAAFNKLYEGPDFSTPTKCVHRHHTQIDSSYSAVLVSPSSAYVELVRHAQVRGHDARSLLAISIRRHRAFPHSAGHVHVDIVVLGL